MRRLPATNLRDLAVALDREGPPDDWPAPPLLLGVVSMGDEGARVVLVDSGSEVGAAPAHPADVLPHLTIPGDWAGLGVIANGWAVPLGEHAGWDDGSGRLPTPPPSARPDRERVRVVELFDRSGRGVAVLHRTGQPPMVVEHSDECEASGAVPDALRRALGLPTPPCPVTTLELYAVLWLEAVLGLTPARKRGRRTASWSRVAALHPALALLVDDGGDRTDRPFLVETARSLGRIADWAYLRRAVGEGRYPWLGVDPGAARWMDDGMFARTVVASSPALGELRAALTTAVSEPVLEQVDAALAAWGLVDAPRQTFKTHPPSADEHDGPDWGGGYPTGAVDEDEEAAAGSVR